MEKKLHKRTVVINKNKNNDGRYNTILPPDLFNDIYDDIKLNGGSGRYLYR